ncbi:RNA 2',3'-cyclic phosphodiesterase [Gluconobacter morbifer]|uniref:RNA 2',3'-cyclic phosphodiesterase n=1 Tax=Gluconobacter morbifer TaxID=479935 RepID=UPI00058D1987|nr:RNA 2',3'-cyclic phosphodiesterase [Gluconobacter morbifer]
MRLFVALDLPDAQREALALLRGSMPGVQWIPAENYHVTLRFIGEVTDRHMMEEIDLALSRLSWEPFALSFHGADLREGMTADSLVIKLDRSPALNALRSQIETALRRAGCSIAKRRFHPFVALGHTATSQRPEAARWVQTHNLFRTEPMPVEHVTLFESLRGYDQHVYIPRAEYAWNPDISLLFEDE